MFDIIEIMTGKTYKEEMDAAWKRYESGGTVNNDSKNPPTAEDVKKHGSGIKAFMYDFGLEKAMNPETLLKISILTS